MFLNHEHANQKNISGIAGGFDTSTGSTSSPQVNTNGHEEDLPQISQRLSSKSVVG
jgi:hypothetical protein